MSSALDEETVKTLDSGRQTVFDLLSSAQTELKKIFLAFAIVFLGAIVAMRYYVWEALRSNTVSRLDPELAADLDLVARTPFDVILMQVKIGLIVGAIAAVIVAVYLGRKAIVDRAADAVSLTTGRLYLFVAASMTLALAGLYYAYAVFFPVMFMILAEQAFQAGVKPTYGIVMYTEFLLLLTISFAIAAQIPLFMGALSYAEIVRYETFRDKWRYAVLGVFVFGMVFSPPDPFTQIMWAIPLLALYGLSLGLSKVVTNIRRTRDSGDEVDFAPYRRRGHYLVLGGLFGGLSGAVVVVSDLGVDVAVTLPDAVAIPLLGDQPLPTGAFVAESALEVGVAGLRGGAIVGGAVLVWTLISILREPVVAPRGERPTVDPDDIDFDAIDTATINTLPNSVFAELSEEDVARVAQGRMDEDPEAAAALLDRWDAVDEAEQDPEDTPTEDDTAADDDTVSETAVGMIDSFTEEETTEDDIGGYLYDIQFILDSLRSRAFVLFGSFIAIFATSFGYLYWRGIEDIMTQFTDRVPAEAFRPGAGATGPTDIVVALHPVEVLIFIVKFSALLSVLLTLPLILYYAWPAVQQRGFANPAGDRRGFLLWGGILMATIVGGAAVGFFVIAPLLVSTLVTDALASGMVIAYRIRSLLWLVFFLTIGVGLFLAVPMTLVLFHASGLVSFDAMARRWRVIVFGIVVAATLLTPRGLMVMVLLAVPTVLAFMLGLGLLWLLTLPQRIRRASDPQAS